MSPAAIEDRTDDLAVDPWRHLGEQGWARLLDLLGRPTRLIVQGRGVQLGRASCRERGLGGGW